MKLLVSSNFVQNDICSVEGKNPSLEEDKVPSLVSEEFSYGDKGDVTEIKTNMIVLSDDEEEEVHSNQNIQPLTGLKGMTTRDEPKSVGPGMIEILDLEKVEPSGFTADISCADLNNATSASVHEEHSTQLCDRQRPVDHVKLISEDVDNLRRSNESSVKSSSLQHKPKLSSAEQTVTLQVLSNKSESFIGSDKKQVNKSETLRKDAHCDVEDDAWEFSFFKSANRNQTLASKVSGPIPKRQIIQLDLPANNRTGNLRFDGRVKRFKPPRLDDWYKPILGLDFFATVGLVSGSDEVHQTATKLKEVPVSFRSPMEYIEVFRPLVLEEFKAQLQSSFQEMTSPDDLSCGSLSVMSIERIDDFHIVRCVHEESNSSVSGSLSENDLILLTKQPFQSLPQDVHIVGKIDKRDRDEKKKSSMLVVRIYLQNGCSRLNRARKSFVERSKWHVSRLMNITPQLREFQALSSIMEIPLITTILDPIKHTSDRHESRKDNLSRLSQPLQHVLKSAYNDSQLQAIGVAIGPFDWKMDFELSLIQGPPGTGKTRTIVAIVSSLLAFHQMSDHKRSTIGGSNSTNSPYTNSRPRISQSVAMARAWQDAALARQLNDEAGKCKESFTRSRVLICAQSNAAVDELVSRISSEGLYDNDGAVYKPYLVRVGNPKTIHPNSLPFFIDTLVDRRLAEEKKDACISRTDPGGDSLQCIRTTLEKLVDSIRFYEAKRSNLRDGVSDSGNLLDDEGVQEDDNKKFSDAELEAKLRVLYGKKKGLYKDLVTAQALERKAREESKSLRYKLRKSILKEAEVVVTTLSGCGGDLYGVCSESFSSHKFSSSTESSLFDAVVIDEAAQALEPATLIPLQLLKSKGTRCVMVGDPKQLPATVLSTTASKYLFQCSMFERLQRAGHPVVMLTQQYRMHPEICHFPSLHFYENKLLNGDQMSSKVAAFHATKYLGPYVFFDVNDGRELHGKNSGALSLYNEREADVAVEILKCFKTMYLSDFSRRKIGIITPYKCQLSHLRSRFSSAFGSSVTAEMEFNTVDGFQGREVDILILSTVRAAQYSTEETKVNFSSIGFVADVRRMNVALTRAKLSLWILGNARTLRTNKNWAALLADAHQRNLVVSISRPYSSTFNPALRDKKNSDRGNPNESKDLVANYVDPRKSAKDVQVRRKNSVSDKARDNNKSTDTIKGKKRVREEGDNVSAKKYASVGVVPKEDSIISDVDSDRSRKQQKHRVKCHESKRIPDIAGKNSEPYKKSKVERYTSFEAADNCRRTSNDKSPNLKTAATSTCKSHKETDGAECHKSINEIKLPNDTISKRKHQREAVDALLSSALISSKKPESSLRSSAVRSTLPRTHAVKPPKPIKVSAASSSQEMHNQINHPARK
ncbi:hypothetical protein Leryth_011364 [Lithospermum erythrorhizon]|nr:hypothetical protein Leryth_011364 [Lithospermum erythrorhizon]